MLLINGAVMLLVYYLVKHLRPQLFMQVKDALPFYGINSVTLGSLLIASRMSTTSQVFSFFGYCLGAGVGLYRRSVDSLVGAQPLVPHPYSQNLPRVPHHLLVPWHPVLGAVRSVGQPASRLNHHLFREDSVNGKTL